MTIARQRSLGPWRSWALVVGGTIGSAPFMLPTLLVPYGGLGLVSLVAAGGGAICIALTLAALSRKVTATGGPYAYAHAAFGDFGGFITAWLYWIAMWTACAGLVTAFSAYLGALIPAVSANPILGLSAGLALTWSVIAINVAGVRESGIVSLATTILKLLPLILLGTVGLAFVDVDNLPPMNPSQLSSWDLFASAFALSFWSYVGIESVTVPSEDVVDSSKTTGRALVMGTLTVTAVILLVALAVMGTIPASELANSKSPLADAATRMFGSWGGTMISIGAVISIIGCLNVTVLCTGQSAMAAARDHVFPTVFARLNVRNTPVASYLIAGLLVSVMLFMNYSKGLVGAYRFIILISTLTSVIAYAFAAMAAYMLRSRDSTRALRLRESGIAIVAFLVCLWVVATSGQETVYWVFLLLMAGMPVYVLVTRGRQAVKLGE